jgi:prolyl 4-hydroxylase
MTGFISQSYIIVNSHPTSQSLLSLQQYESGTLIHGRPFAMKGNYFANVFIHFQPTGRPLDFDNYDFVEELDDFYPPYIVKGSANAEHWKERNPTGWHQESPSGAQVDTLTAFAAAAQNDMEELSRIADQDRRSLIAKDRNGWQPIHEAARGGHLDIIEFLLENGADLNARTHKGMGVSPLKIAREALGNDHVAVKFLEELGAKEFGPEL